MSLIDTLSRMSARFDEVDALVAEPTVLADPPRLRSLLKERGGLQAKVEAYREWRRLEDERVEARAALAGLSQPEEVLLFEEEIRALDLRQSACYERIRELFVTDDEDANRDAILEIRAGTGGDEAALFAGDLFRMYSHYADQHDWTIEILDAAEGGAGGFKEVIAELSGQGVYKHLRYESGGHRVQRVPATETQGRIHTSAATVAVLPQVEEVELQIRDADLRIDTYRSSGPGGQKVNKTSSAIRITHLPTGLVVQCQDEKSQHKNRARAMKILTSRLYELEVQKRHAERSSKRKALIGSGDRSERIRTYNFPQNRVTDHRINLSLYNLDRVMAGDLAPLMGPLLDYDKEQSLQELEE